MTVHRGRPDPAEPYLTDSAINQLGEAMAESYMRQELSSVVLWLSHSLAQPAARIDVAARMMAASVFTQAGLVGIVVCTRCGDRGCGWCKR